MPTTDIEEQGIYTVQRFDRGSIGFEGGLRYDRRTLKATPLGGTSEVEREFDNVSASLGVFYKPADKQFVALALSRNGRAPTEFELFADGPHPGTGGYEVGDADLKSEKVTSLEATYRYTGDRLRLDNRALKTATEKREFTNLSASLGLFYKPADRQFLALTVSRNGRAPTEFELFADGPHPGTGGYEVGDDSLKSEKVTSAEATWRYTGDRLRAEGHLWAAKYDGFIDELRTGAVQDDLPVFQFTQTDARFHGAEAELSYAAWREGQSALKLETAYDWVRGSTDLGPPARVPPWALTGRVVWSAPRVEAHAEVRRVASQNRIAERELPTDGYTQVNAMVTFKPLADSALRLFIDGRNLTDETIREHVSFLKDIAPSPGRSVRAGFAWRF